MVTIIVAVWLGFPWLLVAFDVFKKRTLWMKLSPIAVWLLANILLILPLNWVAPSGPVTVTAKSVEITPNVSFKSFD